MILIKRPDFRFSTYANSNVALAANLIGLKSKPISFAAGLACAVGWIRPSQLPLLSSAWRGMENRCYMVRYWKPLCRELNLSFGKPAWPDERESYKFMFQSIQVSAFFCGEYESLYPIKILETNIMLLLKSNNTSLGSRLLLIIYTILHQTYTPAPIPLRF